VINARLVRLAGAQGITRGRKLRLDTTVVETTIHPPSDSALLADGVRVLSRLLRQARPLVTGPASLFRERVRSARRQARAIGESTRKRGEVGALLRQQAYRRLLAIARAMVRQSRQVAERLPVPAGARLRGALDATATLTEQVIDQTRRRLAGESVPADEKVVSLVEPHTAILRRDKPLRQAEFGHKVLLGEVEGGIIAQVQVLTGNAADSAQLLPSVAAHQAQFGRAPDLCATDRGFWSAGCEEAARRAGVKRVAIPQSGGRVSAARRQQERSRSFRRAQRFRAGGEGRISVCKRRGHLGRCRDHGADGFQRWIGWGVLANNLRVIADHAAAHQP
jgi:IS5 family transposase